MKKITARLLDLALQIQQIPAPTFHESERAKFVHARLIQEGLQEVTTDATGNVYGRYPSPAPVLPPLVISAHLDTVFLLDTDLTTFQEGDRLYGPGIGDNSLGVAGLFGLLWLLQERAVHLPFDIWLVANSCEEGLGDLRGMKAVVDRFGKGVLAYIILEGMALGHIYHRALGVRRYRVSVHTEGGHSWVDYGRPSAIHELAALATRITRLEVPQKPATTLNIGIIAGGTSVNTIAAEAHFELDLRSESLATLENLSLKIESLCQQAQKPGATVEVEVIGARPAGEIPASHSLVQLAANCLREQGIEPKLTIGSTDANIPLSRGVPAVAVGLTTGGGAHTRREFIHLAPIEKGLEALFCLVSRLRETSG